MRAVPNPGDTFERIWEHVQVKLWHKRPCLTWNDFLACSLSLSSAGFIVRHNRPKQAFLWFDQGQKKRYWLWDCFHLGGHTWHRGQGKEDRDTRKDWVTFLNYVRTNVAYLFSPFPKQKWALRDVSPGSRLRFLTWKARGRCSGVNPFWEPWFGGRAFVWILNFTLSFRY